MSEESCDQCGCEFNFPYEWCVCGLPDEQVQQLGRASLKWFLMEREIAQLKRCSHD
jgi:hypothetical protein